MQYTTEININRPLEKVVALFSNPANFSEWMEGFQKYELIEGEEGKAGSKSKFSFKMKNREVEMIETILENNLPKEFTVTYDAKGVHNIQTTRFIKIDDETTKYLAENEFQFKGLMKLMALMPGAFKKQTMKYMENFKKFAEAEV